MRPISDYVLFNLIALHATLERQKDSSNKNGLQNVIGIGGFHLVGQNSKIEVQCWILNIFGISILLSCSQNILGPFIYFSLSYEV